MNSKWWYTVIILSSSVRDDESGLRVCEEQFRLVKAVDFDTAFEKSITLGKDQEHSYENIYGQTVNWEFIGLRELKEISDGIIDDGTEIKSKIFKVDDPLSLIPGKNELLLTSS